MREGGRGRGGGVRQLRQMVFLDLSSDRFRFTCAPAVPTQLKKCANVSRVIISTATRESERHEAAGCVRVCVGVRLSHVLRTVASHRKRRRIAALLARFHEAQGGAGERGACALSEIVHP